MTTPRLTALLALVLLAACGGSLFSNPFSGGRAQRVVLYPEGGFPQKIDNRELMDQVTRVTIEPVIGGVVVHAVGLPPVQGFWDGELVSTNDFAAENGVLTLEFRAWGPLDPTEASTPQSREVVVALFLSRQKMDGVREIRVVGRGNSRALRS